MYLVANYWKKCANLMAHAFSPSTQDAEAGGLLEQRKTIRLLSQITTLQYSDKQ